MEGMGGRSRLHGAMPRLLAVAALLLGILFMHGMSGSASGATPSPAPDATAATAPDPAGLPMGHDADTSAPAKPAHDTAGAADTGTGSHLGMGLAGLCLALLVLGLAAIGRSRGWLNLRREPGRGDGAVVARPVRSRAPDLTALGVLRC